MESTSLYLSHYQNGNIHHKNNPNWRNHPIITQELHKHTHTIISDPPNPSFSYKPWIHELAQKAKTAKTEAQKITTVYTIIQI